MFCGRQRELDLLSSRYESGRFEFVPVYGRRRVGKTRLLKEFIKDKNGIFFTAASNSLEYNLSGLASKLFGADVNASLDAILQEIKRRSSHERFLVIIDEYPKLIKKDPWISDKLQEFIDEIQEDSKLFLILCGSSLSIMEHQVLGYKSPLYGRRTGSLNLKPFDLWDSMKMLHDFSTEDAVKIYGMVGGIPLYLMQFDSSKTMEQNVARAFLDQDSFFANEHTLTLIEEFDNPATYYSVLSAVASGHNRASDISKSSGLDTPTTTKYLKTLGDIGIITKLKPVDNPNGKITLYRISDPFVYFQFGKVLPVVNEVDEENIEEISSRILRSFDKDMGRVFEEMCGQFLKKKYGGTLGTWWGSDPNTKRSEEIDIILTKKTGDKRQGWFAECKYKSSQAGIDVLDTLIHRASLVKGYDVKHYVIFSKGGFTDSVKEKEEVNIYTLDDVLRG